MADEQLTTQQTVEPATANEQAQPAAETTVPGGAVAADGLGAETETQAQTDKVADSGMGEAAHEGEKEDPNKGILGAPEGDYDNSALKLPEGVQLNEGVMTEVAKCCKELNLSQASYNKLISNMSGTFQKRYLNQVSEVKAGFTKQAQADPEIGGSMYRANVSEAAKFYRKFFDAETRQLFEQVGLDRHAGFIKGCLRAQKAMSDDQVLKGAATSGQIDRAKAFFPNSKMN